MFFALIITAIVLIFTIVKWNYSYWSRMGFPFEKPSIPFGVLDAVRRKQRSFGTAIFDVYNRSQEKVLGIYLLSRPALLIRDAEIANNMMSKDFSSFHDRGIYVDEERDPMSATLFSLEGSNWKEMRTLLSPAFSSGKIKGMFETSNAIAERMVKHLNGIVSTDGSTLVEMKKVTSCYAIDIIASVFFGLEVDSFKDPENYFFKKSALFSSSKMLSILYQTSAFLYPGLAKLMYRLGLDDSEASIQIHEIVRQTIQHREENGIHRKDLLELLLQVRNSGKVNADNNLWATAKSLETKALSIEKIAAQMSIFYVAGFETTSSTIAFTIYELALHPDKLEKVVQDIEKAIHKNGGLNYDSIMDMKYLDLCVKETIRKYPALPILNRECTKDYEVPEIKKVIKKGTPIVISLLGINRDPKYFPNPLSYEPERFLEENMNYDPKAYFPFGEGPRTCIAARMGILNVKLALSKLLTNFEVKKNPKQEEITFESHGVVLIPKVGVNVYLAKK